MEHTALKLCRSLLFLPASNARAIQKARELEADLVVLDCEDAVKPEDKAAGRQQAVEAAAQGFGSRPFAIRMNGHGTPYYEEDILAFRQSDAPFIILPKVENKAQAIETAGLLSKPVLAMIESAKGVLEAASIAPHAAALIAGTNDLSADLGIPLGSSRVGLSHSLQAVVLAARAAGLPAFDGVFNGLDDEQGLVRQCEEGRAFGFDGKSLIHPNQIGTTNRIFSPSEEEVAAAQRLIAAASGGAERFEGKMIEAMHVEQARASIAKSRR